MSTMHDSVSDANTDSAASDGPGPQPGDGPAFHRMAAQVPWWRTTAAFFCIPVVWLATAFLALLPLRLAPHAQLPILGPATTMAVALLAVALFLPVVRGGVRLIERRPPGTLSSVVGRLRYRWLGLCLLVALACLPIWLAALISASAVLSVEAPTTPVGTERGEPWYTVLAGGVIILALIVMQATAEEYQTRGWTLQTFRITRSPWPAILVQTQVFTALHAGASGPGNADLMLWGIVLGWLSVRTGGIEAAIAYHVVNNAVGVIIILLTSGLAGLDISTTTIASAHSWAVPLATLVALTCYATTVTFLARRFQIARTSTPSALPTPTVTV